MNVRGSLEKKNHIGAAEGMCVDKWGCLTNGLKEACVSVDE